VSRKADPNDVIDEFQAYLTSSRRNFGRIVRRLNRTPKLQKEASIDAFLRAAVGFETFRSDWHIAAINRDASVFAKTMRDSIKATVKSARDYRGGADLISISLPRHPSVKVIRGVVDPLGRNVAFPDGWEKRCERELASPYKEKVTAMTTQHEAVVAAVVSIRNAIAHRSPWSVAEMNTAIQVLPAGLRRGMRRIRLAGLGSYLWASPRGHAEARVELFYAALTDVAEALRCNNA
jgi:hypothetical protein